MTPHVETVLSALKECERRLSNSPSSRLDSELLLAHALSVSKARLISMFREPFPEEVRPTFEALIQRREKSEPIAYILGSKEFWGLDFKVTPSVLIPRPESELLVEEALRFANLAQGAFTFADLGTGSGCLAISITRELKQKGLEVTCIALDKSAAALEVARANARTHGVEQQIQFVESDWFQNVDPTITFDLIVSNPPYVSRSEKLERDLSFEPESALFSEDAGLLDTTKILQAAPNYLRPDGVILCEVGAGKRDLMKKLRSHLPEGATLEPLGDDSPNDSFTVLKVRY